MSRTDRAYQIRTLWLVFYVVELGAILPHWIDS